jgi:hypothetical protein
MALGQLTVFPKLDTFVISGNQPPVWHPRGLYELSRITKYHPGDSKKLSVGNKTQLLVCLSTEEHLKFKRVQREGQLNVKNRGPKKVGNARQTCYTSGVKTNISRSSSS